MDWLIIMIVRRKNKSPVFAGLGGLAALIFHLDMGVLRTLSIAKIRGVSSAVPAPYTKGTVA